MDQVLVHRFHRRFAVCRDVTLPDAETTGPSGLLYELTQAGCRVSNIGGRSFAFDEFVKVFVPGFGELEGRVRQSRDGTIALRYARPLHLSVLDRLLSVCRSDDAQLAALTLA